jgi:hypothetical protein
VKAQPDLGAKIGVCFASKLKEMMDSDTDNSKKIK